MKKLSAETIYYFRSAVGEFNSGLIFTSIWVLYYSVMELTLTEVSLVFIVITVSNLILEVPTGIIADLYSRRLSIILGGIFIGLAFTLMGAYPLFVVALLTGFIEAIGDTFVSGALEAWITDEVGVDRVSKVFLRGGQVAIPAYWSGVGLSVALAAWFNIQIPIVLGGSLWFVVTLVLILWMPETNFQRPANVGLPNRKTFLEPLRVSLRVFADGLKLVRQSRILTMLFFAQFFIVAFFDSFYKFSRAHILRGFALPVVTLPWLGVLKENMWFGMLEILQGIFSFFGMEGIRRYIDLNRAGMAARVLFGFQALMLVGLFAFAHTGNLFLALLAWVGVSSFLDMGRPVTTLWLNQNIPSHIRSTVLSMNSQIGALGLGGSTGLGFLGDRMGVRNALRLSGLFLLPLLVSYGRSAASTSEPSPVSTTESAD